MIATIIPKKTKHYSVLLDEIISIISPQYGGTFIDCTFGQGGYTKKILEFPNTRVIALDRDQDTQKIASEIENKFKKRFTFFNRKFSEIKTIDLKNEKIQGVIFDLGYSYTQIKDTNKGLSFNSRGELDMRMGLNNFSAKDVINKLDQKELEKIFKFFGDEKDYKKIAYEIKKNIKLKNIDIPTLVQIIESSKKKKKYKKHVATKVFQALRIFVNKEISELIYGLINAAQLIKKNGIIAVVSFHSIEDKIVKYFFKNLSENKSISRYMPKQKDKKNLFKMINKKPISPTDKEIGENISSRSAKLRFVIKKEDFNDFETDILDKFQHLIDIENLSKKL